jgi:hypothetical protein
MSGPIVRKYGFPNFDKIFGERPLEHGVDDTERAPGATGEELTAKREEKQRANTEESKPTKS